MNPTISVKSNYYFFIINIVFWTLYLFPDPKRSTVMGSIFGVLEWGLVLGITLLIQLLIFFVLRLNRKQIKWIARFSLFALPSIVVFSYIHLFPVPEAKNRQRHLVSPSQNYYAEVYTQNKYWNIEIYSKEQELLFQDNHSFVFDFKIYWYWDNENRLWVYSSDTQTVNFIETLDGTWKISEWGWRKEKHIERDLIPPEEIYLRYEGNTVQQGDSYGDNKANSL